MSRCVRSLRALSAAILIAVAAAVVSAVPAIPAAAQEAAAAATPAAAPAEAPKYGWANTLVGALNFTQTSFGNWAEGGTNSSAWQVSGSGTFKRVAKPTTWTSNVKLEYGEVRQEDLETRKALDLIFLESVLDFNTSRYLKPYVAATAKTQFARGYDYKKTPSEAVSDFRDPLLLTQSAGIGYQVKPWLMTRLGGALQETFTDEFRQYSDDAATLDELEKTKVEGGLESVTTADRWFGERLNVKSRLALFWAFNNSDQVDADWMTDVTLKAWGALGVTLKLQMLYNKDVLDAVQVKQILGVGVSYAFI